MSRVLGFSKDSGLGFGKGSRFAAGTRSTSTRVSMVGTRLA